MSCRPCRRTRNLFFLLVFLPQIGFAGPSEEELFFKSISEVNEGVLRFLATPPERQVHHHQNRVTLSRDSLVSGWVKLEQCHQHIDAVPNSQITYNVDRIRALHITRIENIGRAWVEGNSVQLESIRPDAVICIEAETRALQADEGNGYLLRNGPYMRRFLDGYYPMRVSMTVRLGESGLRFDSLSPVAQPPGFSLHVTPGEVAYDALFEGQLQTVIRLVIAPPQQR